ncbi:hypothetical protein GCM10010207_68160 [Streptomyces atratus]|nr:hypothetical protein GCM10010207_68160 [Streptomyces atratus]
MTSAIPGPHTDASGMGPVSDQAGRLEAHGIGHIPERERRGRARGLFAVRAAANVDCLSLAVGGALILMGLSLWPAAVTVVGNLLWAPVGLPAVSGPASGTPSEVITRTMFGIRGNRANITVAGWAISTRWLPDSPPSPA